MPENERTISAALKRFIDVLGATVGLLLCAPLMLLMVIFIWINAGSPVLYRESRIGLHQKPFQLFKLRSMKISKNESGASVASGDDQRVLSFGHFLRESHLDELPQLYSVLKGDMSLVGPRPYKASHFKRFSPDFRQIISSVKPGLTGSDSLIFIAEDQALKGLDNPEAVYLQCILPEKAKEQIKYIQTQSNLKDLRLILATLRAIFFRNTRRKSVCYLRSLFADKH